MKMKITDQDKGHYCPPPTTQLTVKDVTEDGTPTSQHITVTDEGQDSPLPTTQLTVKNAAEHGTQTLQHIILQDEVHRQRRSSLSRTLPRTAHQPRSN